MKKIGDFMNDYKTTGNCNIHGKTIFINGTECQKCKDAELAGSAICYPGLTTEETTELNYLKTVSIQKMGSRGWKRLNGFLYKILDALGSGFYG